MSGLVGRRRRVKVRRMINPRVGSRWVGDDAIDAFGGSSTRRRLKRDVVVGDAAGKSAFGSRITFLFKRRIEVELEASWMWINEWISKSVNE